MSIANLLNSKSFKIQVQALGQQCSPTPIAGANAGINLTAENIVDEKLLIINAGAATAAFNLVLPEPLTVSTALSYNPYDPNLLNQTFEFNVMNISGQDITITQSATADFSVQAGTAEIGDETCGRILYQVTRVGNPADATAKPPVVAVTPQMKAYVL